MMQPGPSSIAISWNSPHACCPQRSGRLGALVGLHSVCRLGSQSDSPEIMHQAYAYMGPFTPIQLSWMASCMQKYNLIARHRSGMTGKSPFGSISVVGLFITYD